MDVQEVHYWELVVLMELDKENKRKLLENIHINYKIAGNLQDDLNSFVDHQRYQYSFSIFS